MTKAEFLDFYRNPADLKIRVYFDDDEFLQNDAIVISESHQSAQYFDTCYVPRYSKNDRLETRSFEKLKLDPSVKPVKLNKVKNKTDEWHLESIQYVLPIDGMWAIPIATDLDGRRLILDSNHAIIKVINSSDPSALIPIIEISGTNMLSIVDDFSVLSRYK